MRGHHYADKNPSTRKHTQIGWRQVIFHLFKIRVFFLFSSNFVTVCVCVCHHSGLQTVSFLHMNNDEK